MGDGDEGGVGVGICVGRGVGVRSGEIMGAAQAADTRMNTMAKGFKPLRSM
jgi:hypothetical protein